MSNSKRLEQKINSLPQELLFTVEKYIDTIILSTRPSLKKYKLRQSWGGKLKKHRKIFTSLDLQKKAADWRIS